MRGKCLKVPAKQVLIIGCEGIQEYSRIENDQFCAYFDFVSPCFPFKVQCNYNYNYSKVKVRALHAQLACPLRVAVELDQVWKFFRRRRHRRRRPPRPRGPGSKSSFLRV